MMLLRSICGMRNILKIKHVIYPATVYYSRRGKKPSIRWHQSGRHEQNTLQKLQNNCHNAQNTSVLTDVNILVL